MKARNALTGLALVLGMALPAGAQTLDGMQLAQAPTDATRPAQGPGARQHWGQRPEGHGGKHGHHGWQRRAGAHRFSLSRLALRHQKDLALTPAQVDSLRKLGTDARRDAIKRQADRRLAELDLRTMMAPDSADPNKPRDLAKIETKVREIEKMRADGRVAQIRNLEQSRQVLTPEQREKLRTLLSQRMQHRGPQGPGMRGLAPEDGGQKPAASEETTGPTAG
jgi:Spy/CpxP family protein refolding chaperone